MVTLILKVYKHTYFINANTCLYILDCKARRPFNYLVNRPNPAAG